MMGAVPILESLTRADVKFVVIGMLAATLQGSPMRTDDVDICPETSPANLETLAGVLTELGAKEWDPHKGEAVDRDWSAELLQADQLWILRTDHGPLDLLFRPRGTDGYQDLVRDALFIDLDDLQVQTASLRAIIRMKETAGREKDLTQLPSLRRLLEKLEGTQEPDL